VVSAEMITKFIRNLTMSEHKMCFRTDFDTFSKLYIGKS